MEWIVGAPKGPAELPTWNPQPTIDADLCPVVWVNLQSGSMVKGFNSQVLDFFRLSASGAAHQTSTAAVRALARHGVRTLHRRLPSTAYQLEGRPGGPRSREVHEHRARRIQRQLNSGWDRPPNPVKP